MLIAQQLQEKSRAEFLLYMWQVEDILRAHGCDIDRLRENYLSQFQLPAEQAIQVEEWYANLCAMLREEGKTQSGHLQINQNIIEGLADVHRQLLQSGKFPYYREMYYKVLPYVVELRAKNKVNTSATVSDELQMCFELLYGVMLLRLQKKEISTETLSAAKEVSTLLGQLSDYWKADKEGKLLND